MRKTGDKQDKDARTCRVTSRAVERRAARRDTRSYERVRTAYPGDAGRAELEAHRCDRARGVGVP